MTMQGYADTLPVTLEEMILYGRSVARGCPPSLRGGRHALYELSGFAPQALANAGPSCRRPAQTQ